jgi:predicted TIM-barrel fold metal-dependent hydrolase
MAERLPKNSCDAHLHVFGDAGTYPVGNLNALYRPPQDCNFAAMTAMHDAMGIDRAVLVQPTIYGTDHSLLHDVLKAAPKGKYRGVAIVDDSVSDAELQRLNDVGVRGARFNFGGNFKLAPSIPTLRRTLDRVRELGWFVKVFGFGDDFLAVEDELRNIKIPAIVDHLGGPDYARGTSAPVIRLILDLLKSDNWWIGLSNGDLRSKVGEPWDDAVEFGRLFYRAAPDRCLWGTDWPHVHRFIRPEEAGHAEQGAEQELKRAALLGRYVPDRAARDRVLVDNPARFFGFGS